MELIALCCACACVRVRGAASRPNCQRWCAARALCGCVATPSERERESLLRNCVISHHSTRWSTRSCDRSHPRERTDHMHVNSNNRLDFKGQVKTAQLFDCMSPILHPHPLLRKAPDYPSKASMMLCTKTDMYSLYVYITCVLYTTLST